MNCVLPVDMYDTTGDIDVHLNKELVNVATELHKQSKQCKYYIPCQQPSIMCTCDSIVYSYMYTPA